MARHQQYMSPMKTITHYRNDATGELAPPHRLGTTEDGESIYQGVEGWTPVDSAGVEVEVEYVDTDGNWIVRTVLS